MVGPAPYFKNKKKAFLLGVVGRAVGIFSLVSRVGTVAKVFHGGLGAVRAGRARWWIPAAPRARRQPPAPGPPALALENLKAISGLGRAGLARGSLAAQGIVGPEVRRMLLGASWLCLAPHGGDWRS